MKKILIILMLFTLPVAFAGITTDYCQAGDNVLSSTSVDLSTGVTLNNVSGETTGLQINNHNATSYAGIYWYPELHNGDNYGHVAMTVHEDHPNGDKHEHWSLYTSNSTGSRINRMSVDYGTDLANITYTDINTVFYDDTDLDRVDAVGEIASGGYFAFFSSVIQVRGGDLEPSGDLSASLGGSSKRWEMIYSENVTLRSPDGTNWNCGVSNGGTFSCS